MLLLHLRDIQQGCALLASLKSKKERRIIWQRQSIVRPTCSARSSHRTFKPQGSETGLSLSRLISLSLSGENHLQLVNAFKQVWHKMTDKNALCSLHPSLARNINASGPKNRADVNLKWSKYQSINQPNKCPFLSNEWGEKRLKHWWCRHQNANYSLSKQKRRE